MNQLLITTYMDENEERIEKQYQPNKLRNSKVLVIPIIVLILMFLLSSYYVYAMYNKSTNQNEEQQVSSVEINENADIEKETGIVITEAVEENIIEEEKVNEENVQEVSANVPSEPYDIAYLKISKINLNLPVLSQTSEELMNQKLNKFWGGDPNEVGNFCIIGHNYKRFLKRLPEMNIGDTIEIKDLTERTLIYKIYDIYEVNPKDTSCTSQLTDGKKEVTLITCVVGGKERLIIKAAEVI